MIYRLPDDTELKKNCTGNEFIILEFIRTYTRYKYLNLVYCSVNLMQSVLIISFSVFHIS